jgi:hypothetical protein
LRLRGAVAAVAGALLLAGVAAGAARSLGPIAALPDTPGLSQGYLGFCKSAVFQKSWSCYVKNLRRVVDDARSPATELPVLDVLARQSGGFLEANCHMMMHVVGRSFAVRHHVTLANLQRYLPKSNDPGCSAGFGMGMVMALGAQITHGGPKGAYAVCDKAGTRFQRYTCFHSLGHAYMRYYDGYLSYGLKACRALGRREAPDCAQGVFHDYWLGLSGQDDAKSRRGEPRTARELCGAQHGIYVVACWYRYFLVLPPKLKPTAAGRIDALCRGLAGYQREGCVAAASVISNPLPSKQFSICSHLAGADVDSCMRGVLTQDLPDVRSTQLDFISRCGSLGVASRAGCYRWFGTIFSVITNGRFAQSGCAHLGSPAARTACLAGVKRMNDALVTFA